MRLFFPTAIESALEAVREGWEAVNAQARGYRALRWQVARQRWRNQLSPLRVNIEHLSDDDIDRRIEIIEGVKARGEGLLARALRDGDGEVFQDSLSGEFAELALVRESLLRGRAANALRSVSPLQIADRLPLETESDLERFGEVTCLFQDLESQHARILAEREVAALLSA